MIQNKKLKIAIRTSGGKETNKELGLGHVYRTLNLALELRTNEIHFLLEDYGGSREIIKKNNFKDIHILKKDIELNDDIDESLRYIIDKKIDILIVDRYKLKKTYLKKLLDYVKIVVISDLYNIEYRADLVVNGFVGFKNSVIKNSFNSRCLLGPKYQIINQKFSIRSKNIKPKYDLLISVGGYDQKNIIDVILNSILPYINKIKIKIILGPVGNKSKLVEKLEKRFPRQIFVLKSTKNMKKEIESAKFGISNGGMTSYEFASMKKFFGIICIENHQLITAKEWETKGYAKNLGVVKKGIEKNIVKFLEESVIKNIQIKINSKDIVDGYGLSRISNEILKI